MSHSPNESAHGGLSHFDSSGAAHMVDVGDKAYSKRVAIAQGSISMQPQTLLLIKQGGAKKGDVLGTARLAAIMATKKTADLIPLCHPLSLSHVAVEFSFIEQSPSVLCKVRCETTGQTGVEMEALVGVQIGLLTIYDMCKALDKSMTISQVCLQEKTGGKSGAYVR